MVYIQSARNPALNSVILNNRNIKLLDNSSEPSKKEHKVKKPIGISNSYLTGYHYTKYLHPITKKIINDLDIEVTEDNEEEVKTYFFVDKCKNEIINFDDCANRNGKILDETRIKGSLLRCDGEFYKLKTCLKPIKKLLSLKTSYDIPHTNLLESLLENTDLRYHDQDEITNLLENKCKTKILDYGSSNYDGGLFRELKECLSKINLSPLYKSDSKIE